MISHWIGTVQRARNCLVLQILKLWVQAEDFCYFLLFYVAVVHIENGDHLAVFPRLDNSASVPVSILEFAGNDASNFRILNLLKNVSQI